MPIWQLWIVHVARCSQMTIVRTHIASDMAVADVTDALRRSPPASGHAATALLQLQREMPAAKRGGNPAGA